MDYRFFEQPILNSPYEYPARHWELDPSGQPTQQILDKRRRAEFITPIPKPKKRRAARRHVDQWRTISNPNHWQVTPETVRLLQHWRHHKFNGVRPFFSGSSMHVNFNTSKKDRWETDARRSHVNWVILDSD